MANVTATKIQTLMQAQMNSYGVQCEITFISAESFSVLCDDAASFEKAKKVMAMVKNATYTGEDCDEECGYCAFYTF